MNIPDEYVVDNCELVAFVQDVDSKEVMQTTKVNLGNVVGLNELSEKFTRVYPNPASGNVTIESASAIKHINIYEISGRMVYSVALDQNKVDLNIEFLNNDIYIIQLETENGTRIEKLNVY